LPRRFLYYLLFFLSGAASLGYQIIWSRLFALGLGHELPAILGVLTTFLLGLGTGAWASKLAQRSAPNRSYALVELAIAVWGVGSSLLIPLATPLALRLIGLDSLGRHWLVAFAFPLITLLPGTIALGATFPIMERCISALAAEKRSASEKSGGDIGAIYAANTLGAVAGTIGSIFGLLPQLGLRKGLLVLAAVNVCCAVAAFFIPLPGRAPCPPPRRDKLPLAFSRSRLAMILAATGFLGIGVEVVVVRVLSQVIANTIYSYAAVLASFLFGTFAGAAVSIRFGGPPSRSRINLLLTLLAASLIPMLLLLHFAPSLYAGFTSMLGDTIWGMILCELLTAAAVLLVPTMLMGATFAQLIETWREQFGAIAQPTALNTIGSALAPMAFNLILLPLIGSRWTLALIALGYLALPQTRQGKQWIFAGTIAALVVFLPFNLQLIDLPTSGALLEYREGPMATVAVVEDVTRNRTLRVNNHFQMGGTGAADAEYRHAHIPLLLHRNPHRALILGFGTGITTGGAIIHSNITVDAVELLPEVLKMTSRFEPWNRKPQDNPAVRLHVADARRYVKLATNQYDVIIADLFHPSLEGAATLFTREHFAAIRERLSSDGLFCQWLPMHQLDFETLQCITHTFLDVFPETDAYLLRFNVDAPVLGLIVFV